MRRWIIIICPLVKNEVFNILQSLKYIKTINELNETRNEKIDELLKNDNKIFILTFGFDKENVNFLKLREHLEMKTYETYISNYDNSDEKIEMILKEI